MNPENKDYTLSQKRSQTEKNSPRRYYFIYSAIVFLTIFLAWIGLQTQAEKDVATYYMLFGVFSLSFIIADVVSKGKFGFFDSVTVEKTPISPKTIAILSVVFGLVFGVRILLTQQAFVSYPTFSILDSSLLGSILSGLFGIVEDITFLSFVFPTLFTLINRRTDSRILAAFFSILSLGAIAMTWHYFVYRIDETALITTFMYFSGNAVLVYGLKTTITSNALHVTNNIVGSMVRAGVRFLFW